MPGLMRGFIERWWRSAKRILSRDTGGTELAEFAVILPLLLLILFGIFWFGQAFRIYGAITNAARDGARAAVAPPCTTCAVGNNDPTALAWSAIQNDLNAANINPLVLQQPATAPALCACYLTSGTGCTAVACDTGQNHICVQGVSRASNGIAAIQSNVELSSPASGGVGECGLSVSFQYPYSFWLPFSSLNHETINLRAQSQMRAETQ